ncbi:MAG: Cytochrome c-type biogenesis protein CcmH, partial [Alphaproteobacteria bacterium MarineAlpha6_Bin4]
MKKFLILIITTLFFQNILADENLEKKARDINKKIRCVVCQSQSIDDSDSILARDLRKLIKEKLNEGQSEKEITDYLVERYGEFILLKPK